MDQFDFKVGDRVFVSTTATGLGIDIPGTITSIEECLGNPIISVRYDRPLRNRNGITVSNPGVIYKIPHHE